jgi:DNA-binding Lrp family transcriptional regulator
MNADDIDYRVLAALLADGRASDSELCQVADVASSTATWHKTLLEADDVIQGYEPRIDYAAFGYDVTAVFEFEVGSTTRDTATQTLCDIPQLHTVYEMAGPTDIIAIGRFTSTTAHVETLRRLRAAPQFASVTTDVVDPRSEFELFMPEATIPE